jgi:hypothetical protein
MVPDSDVKGFSMAELTKLQKPIRKTHGRR